MVNIGWYSEMDAWIWDSIYCVTEISATFLFEVRDKKNEGNDEVFYEEHISPDLIDKMEGTRLFLLSWTLPKIT